jgi:hypothetical protein
MSEQIGTGLGLPAEAVPDVLGEQLEVVEAGESDQNTLEDKMFDMIVKQRTMALGLTMAGARTRDGLYTAWAYNATATAGLLVELLRRQDTDHSRELLSRFDSDEATKEHNSGTRMVF